MICMTSECEARKRPGLSWGTIGRIRQQFKRMMKGSNELYMCVWHIFSALPAFFVRLVQIVDWLLFCCYAYNLRGALHLTHPQTGTHSIHVTLLTFMFWHTVNADCWFVQGEAVYGINSNVHTIIWEAISGNKFTLANETNDWMALVEQQREREREPWQKGYIRRGYFENKMYIRRYIF